MEPLCDPAAEQRENLLFLLGKMREMQAARGLQSFKRSSPNCRLTSSGYLDLSSCNINALQTLINFLPIGAKSVFVLCSKR